MRESGWIKNILFSLGADGCGLVSLADQRHNSFCKESYKILTEVKTIIVFYRKFPRYAYASNEADLYNQDFSDMISSVDLISYKLAAEIEAAGSRAVAVPSDEETESNKGLISLRHYAVLAGLGSIGKNNLLITPRFGSMVELGAVITDMEFTGDTPMEKSLCIPGCSRCIQACPRQALGNNITKVNLCKETVASNDSENSLSRCWSCRSVCPLNISLSRKSEYNQ
jgi:epoxyqueuosine reductase QueG